MDPDPSLFQSINFELIIGIFAIFILLILSAFISGSEVALFSLSQKNIDDVVNDDSNKGNLLQKLLQTPKKLLATILVANNFVNIAIVILFSSISGQLFGGIASPVVRFVLEVIVVTFLILLCGEVLPKIYANRNNVLFSKMVVVPISILDKILAPISIPMRNAILYIEKKLNVQKGNFSVDQLSQALELTHQSETTVEEQKILEGIVTFGSTEVKQVMIPRIDVFAINIEDDFEAVLPNIVDKGYSRIPVYRDNIDQIEGVLFIKDLIPFIDETVFTWQTLIRKPFFVPENKKLDNLLKDFQAMKNHLAVVVDEYGGTCGIITLEDVLEEIVGDISDEFDDDDVSYTQIDEHNYLFEGKTSLKDFYRVVDIEEDEFEDSKGEAETLAGFLLEISGNFPKKKQKLTFNGIIFSIENIDKRRIKQIKVTLP
ncbi:gliding motility-associated protein GldE [Flavobacterium ardleyense]|uniref:Gliding motility-associated protein GldE n=1 Tax=Flavobacterium ardleyense TaxID=2038737 RepID=A0ABW5Z643_9FLAO